MICKDFEYPPINESYLGFQFSIAPNEWNTLDFGDFYSEHRNEFPLIQEQDEIAPIADGNLFSIGGLPPLRRVWLIKKDKKELLQLQRDRMLYNWRKLSDSDSYPRFESLFQEFKKYWISFEKYCEIKKDSKVNIQWAEFTYTNVIDESNGLNVALSNINKLLTFINFDSLNRNVKGFNFALNLESKADQNAIIQVIIRDGANMKTKKRLLYLELKSVLKTDDKDRAFEWLNKTRLELRELFCALTTDNAQSNWGLKNGISS